MSRPCSGLVTPLPRPKAAATSPARANDPVSARTNSTIASVSMPIGIRARTAAPSRRVTSGARRTRAKRSPPITRCLRGLAALDAELLGALGESGDDERDVLVEVDAELLGARANLVAVDRRREARLLELLLDRLGRHAVDALGPHVRAREHEAAELVDGVQGLLEQRVARDAEEV